MIFIPPTNFSLFKQRRNLLLELVHEQYPQAERGFILLFAGFEASERTPFRQESSFYYLTGITEPAAVLAISLDEHEVLYLPRYGDAREKWVNVSLRIGESAKHYEIDEVRALGQQERGYSFIPEFEKNKYDGLLSDLHQYLDQDSYVFTLLDGATSSYRLGRQLYEKMYRWLPILHTATKDISSIVHEMRRTKDQYEVDQIYKAVQVTSMAQKAAAQGIVPGRFEYQVQAALEYLFTYVAAAQKAFPSIVATGKNSTILHYTDNCQQIGDDDLVVVDIGAEYGFYAADLTRTYPSNGTFSPRQKEVYQTVLDTQLYVESIAQPGMFLKNPAQPEKSLHHLAIKFLQQRGYDKYFVHGIGHYMGLDVHDVGDYNLPLRAGDVFTIEPGIYIPDEKLGVRIEDDYVMSDEGAVCLSFDLPKTIEDIEEFMKNT